MKTNLPINKLLIAGLTLTIVLIFSCKKETSKPVPSITGDAVTNVTATTATSGGNVTSDGGSTLIAKGVCWSINMNPTISDNKTINGTGTGKYTSSITGLKPGTTYYLKAYATNGNGTAFGNQVSITTMTILPVITSITATSITTNTAISGGNITNDGGAAITLRGVCWSTIQNPTTANSKTTDGTGTGNFTSSITGLSPGVTYNIRAYATNIKGTNYGNQITLTTLALPVVTTTAVTSITAGSVSTGGNISSDGGTVITARGVCYSTMSNPTITNSKTTDGNGSGSFTSVLTGLSPLTLYYVRAYATNSAGTSYGSSLSFTTTNSPTSVGQSYGGGIIAYIFKAGDPGYLTGQIHGLIAYKHDAESTVRIGLWYETSSMKVDTFTWCRADTNANVSDKYGFTASAINRYPRYVLTNAMGVSLGTGSSNTIKINSIQLIGIPAPWVNGSSSFSLSAGTYNAAGFITNVLNINSLIYISIGTCNDCFCDWYLPSKDELNKLYINKEAIGGFVNFPYWSSSATSNGAPWCQTSNGGSQGVNNMTELGVRAIRSF